MADKYQDFNQLSSFEKDGKDFKITMRVVRSPFAIAAIHGGAIESGTSEIADKIAGRDFSYYTFEGIKPASNWDLHITSTKFDEPCFQVITAVSQKVISIHGCAERGRLIFLGGLDQSLKSHIAAKLLESGFCYKRKDMQNRRGISRRNVCNRARTGKGLQIEISRGLRGQMIIPHEKSDYRRLTPLFFRFINAVRLGLFNTLTNKINRG